MLLVDGPANSTQNQGAAAVTSHCSFDVSNIQSISSNPSKNVVENFSEQEPPHLLVPSSVEKTLSSLTATASANSQTKHSVEDMTLTMGQEVTDEFRCKCGKLCTR